MDKRIFMWAGWAVALVVAAVFVVYVVRDNGDTDTNIAEQGEQRLQAVDENYNGDASIPYEFELIELGDFAVATLNGVSISAQNVGFLIPEAEWGFETEYITMFPDDRGVNFEREFRDGLTFGRVVREEAVRLAAVNLLYLEYAEQNGIYLTPDEIFAINSDINEMMFGWDPDELDSMLMEDAIQGIYHLRQIYQDFALVDTVIETIIFDDEKFAAFEAYLPSTDDLIAAKHIWLEIAAFGSEEAAMFFANELHARLMQGENFDTLMLEYSQDPLAEWAPDGFTLVSGASLPQFEEAILAMSIGEISAPIQIYGGVHIIQRVVPDEDYIIFAFEEGPSGPEQRRAMAIQAGFEAKLANAELVFMPELDELPVGFGF